MSVKVDIHGRPVVYEGAQARIVCAVTADGKSPSFDFLQETEKSNEKEYTKIAALFRRLCNVGKITNKQKFKLVERPIWAFKSFQHRLPCFQNGNDWILTHGFIKKRDDWPKAEIKRAKRIREEDLTRSKSS